MSVYYYLYNTLYTNTAMQENNYLLYTYVLITFYYLQNDKESVFVFLTEKKMF